MRNGTRRIILLLATLVLLCTAGTALAADTFIFTEKKVTIFEGETWEPTLKREGIPAGGEVTWSVGNPKILSVSQDGVVTALQKGETTVSASVKGKKRVWKTTANVKVARRVTKVTLNTGKLTVYRASDPAVFDYLEDGTEYPVLLLSAGKSVQLSATCTPEDATDKSVTWSTTDAGVARVRGRELQGVQAGECDLICQSVQNPEVTETYHVLVTQPVTKLEIQAESKILAAGDSMQLGVTVIPANATIQQVEWSSRNPAVATVDEDGMVTGIKKGTVTIDAKAKDGSGRSAAVALTISQKATGLTLKETEVRVVTGKRVTLTPRITPAETNDKNVTWSSSDESIATVSRGSVTGVRAGTCEITCTSVSNPELSATATVEVIQQVKQIQFTTENGVSFHVNTTCQLYWTVSPSDASIQDVTFASRNPKVATVDQNGLVTGISRGTATITATATDGSGRQGSIKVNVTQPVEGVSIQYGTYHVQIHRTLSIKALLQPSNASDTRMSWSMGDEYVASVSGGKNVATVRGLHAGTTTITGVTEDGGYSASAEVRVADFNGAVMIEEFYLNEDGRIRIVFRNMSDFTIDKVYFTVWCYDTAGAPIVCNADGYSTSFDGAYPLTMGPGERSEHGEFDLRNMAVSEPIGVMVLRITSWKDSEGYTRNIHEEEDQPMETWTNIIPPAPGPIPDPVEPD